MTPLARLFDCTHHQQACPVALELRGPGRDKNGRPVLRDQNKTAGPIRQAIGFVRQQELALSTYCSNDASHCALGHIALHLATCYGGVISLDGRVAPAGGVYTTHGLKSRQRDEGVQSGMRGLIELFPGTVWHIFARGVDPRTEWWSGCYIVDTLFMSAWLRHQLFRLPK